jgi:glycosyltransferase involved in cell wall biosynthesis
VTFRQGAALGMLVKIWPKLSETFILEEALGLERQGTNLNLYALAPPSDEISHPAVARVQAPLACVPALAWPQAGALLGAHLRRLAARPAGWLRAAARAARRGRAGLADFARAAWLADRLAADGVTHLHTHFISGPADIAELAATMLALPWSISAHAKDIYTSRPEDLRRKLSAARFTVTCTEFNRRTLAAIEPAAQVHRMYHGIDHGVFHPSRRGRLAPVDGCAGEQAAPVPMLLAVGRLRAKKGLDTLIDACAMLKARGRRVRCEIVGYGDERGALLARIAAQGLEDEVHLAGKLMREQVIERYARTAVFVQPSRVTADGDRDGIPNVLLEAMAMGLPVVASAVSGIPELVADSSNGLLVPPDAPDALADAIERVLDTPALAARLGAAARERVIEHFDNDRNLRLLARLLEQAHEPQARHAARIA